jgi:lambda repressor-like predicted transcriptional regulator
MKLLRSILVGLLFTCSLGASAQSLESFKFVALGDMPYSIPEDYPRYERLIAAINQTNPSFSIFIGDTKSGSTPCSDEYNLKVKSYFNQFTSPLIYSIGDNEWTDCHRPLAGSYDPIERLDKLRSTFFNTRKSFGKQQLELTRQSDVDPRYQKFVENAYWVKNQFLFVSIHIPGSNNNFERDEQAKAEYFERNQANLEWIQNSFTLAQKMNYLGIIFCYQADMFYTPTQAVNPDSGYRDTLQVLSKNAQAFKKPVLLIHGDSHRLILDQPLKTVDQKHTLENVLRLQVMGAEQVQAVTIGVNPKSEQPFTFTPILLRQNMTTPGP